MISSFAVETTVPGAVPGNGRKRNHEENDGEEDIQSVYTGVMRNIPKKKKNQSSVTEPCRVHRIKRFGCVARSSSRCSRLNRVAAFRRRYQSKVLDNHSVSASLRNPARRLASMAIKNALNHHRGF